MFEHIDPPSPTRPRLRQGMIQGRSSQNPKTNPKLRQKGKQKTKQTNKQRPRATNKGSRKTPSNNATRQPKGTQAQTGTTGPHNRSNKGGATSGKKRHKNDKTGATKQKILCNAKRPKRATKQKISHNMKGPKRATKQTALAHNKNEKDKCDKRDAIKRQCRRNKWQDTQQISKRSTPKPRGKHALRGQTHVGRAKSTHQGNENASGQASTEQLTHAPVGQPWPETTQRPTRTSVEKTVHTSSSDMATRA